MHRNYRELLEDPNIDAVYIPLPPALHGYWTKAAVEAGKHVLVEKPFTANADEAREVEGVVQKAKVVVMEAHHASHHPQTQRAASVIRSGALGKIESVRASFCVPMVPDKGIPWNPELGGGSLMDLGCYPVRWISDVLGTQPTVRSARARARGEIDASMEAELDYEGVRAVIHASLWSPRLMEVFADVQGSNGRMRVRSPYLPQLFGRIRVSGAAPAFYAKAERTTTYTYQLRAFRDAILHGGPVLTGPSEASQTMTTIDSIYRAAGMNPRRPAAHVEE